jgi:hypothetical protein
MPPAARLSIPDRIEAVDDRMAKVLRGKTGAERLAIAWGMFDMARSLVRSNVRATHPDWDDGKVTAEVARRLSRGATDGLSHATR